MNVHAYFSCVEPNANKLERLSERLTGRGVSFEILNTVSGRIVIDLIGGRNDLAWMVTKFTELQLDPKVIAAFRTDNGRKIRDYPVDRAEWRLVAHDVQTGVDGEGNPVYGRPALNDFRQVHGWLGHPMDDEQDED